MAGVAMDDANDLDHLIGLIKIYNPGCDEKMIREAYSYGAFVHEGQLRRSGEPYFTHPVAVATILATQRLDDASIVTALLHDTIEDTDATRLDLVLRFGEEIADLTEGVTKLKSINLNSERTKQAENFRKLFMAMSKDLRVILVKLADRLHNMRTLRHMKPEKQLIKARETMDIYAPLAGRMGMQEMREELEDLCFQVTNPKARRSILRHYAMLTKEAGDVVERIKADMRMELLAAGIRGAVYGRAKKPFSIWRKMQDKGLKFSRLSDIYGFRVITETEEDCYRALGVIHRRWKSIPGRFKDYISQPKTNGYRSLHTTVSGRDGKRVEVQIRTREMHDVAETGVAAHWSYRDGIRSQNRFAVDPAKWLSTLQERFGEDIDHDAFLEGVKLEMYSDKVFCYTPKGEVVKLPRGATPIDFAYAIHTRIGHACIGAIVDGVRVPVWSRLKNGQSVEIITANGAAPRPGWLEAATTGKAKTAIRRLLREQDRARHAQLGRELALQAFEHASKSFTDKALEIAAKELGRNSTNALLAELGRAEISAREVVLAVYPEIRDMQGGSIEAGRAVIGLKEGESFGRANCCQPIPGERIVGITTRGHGVTIHAINCERLAKYDDEPDRWIDLLWHEGKHPAVHPVTIILTIAHASGVLGRICNLIGEREANISDMTFIEKKPDFYRIQINVDVADEVHLHDLMTILAAQSDVAEIERRRDPTLKGIVEMVQALPIEKRSPRQSYNGSNSMASESRADEAINGGARDGL